MKESVVFIESISTKLTSKTKVCKFLFDIKRIMYVCVSYLLYWLSKASPNVSEASVLTQKYSNIETFQEFHVFALDKVNAKR